MLEIYDCTLREGEQAAGARFSLDERLELFQKLDEFGIDFIELGWPSASQEVLDSFQKARKIRKHAKIVAFGRTSKTQDVENDENLKRLIETGADYACIFGKTTLEHVEKQLKITAEENLRIISKSVEFLGKSMPVFYDAEHYFDGFKEDKDYAIKTLVAAINSGAKRLILCDTNGGTLPEEARQIIRETREKLKEKGCTIGLGIHFHDDCGLALANTLSCLDDIVQVQGTINGIGERIGNLNFSEFLPVYMLKLGKKLNIDLKKLRAINEESFRISGISVPEIRAFVGDTAFAHKGGVHVDAVVKGASYRHMNPEDVGNKEVIILNTLGGGAVVASVAKQFGYCLDKRDPDVEERTKRLFEELRPYEKEGYRLGMMPAEQFLLIEKHFGNFDPIFTRKKWRVVTEEENGVEKSVFTLQYFMDGKMQEKSMLVHGGPVDAAYKTIKAILRSKYPEIDNLQLVDFNVFIARPKKEESTVRTLIYFRDEENRDFLPPKNKKYFCDGEEFETVGVHSNILSSAIEAIEKGVRYYINSRRKGI